jgi:hypothetical protein
MEETGLCLFLPRKQSAPSLAPSFVEAVVGERNVMPTQKQIATAEELLVRLELDGVAVRLNLQGQPGEQPDYIVASWVLPYVYALRGDRDWRRVPQLTGSRQVSPLAVQAYKRLEQGEATVSELRTVLGQGVTETAVVRAITELWQQLRIIPVIAAPGKAAKWQLLRVRFQKAIAEGASTSQVTAISVLASIFLQAVIAASMEEVELFLASLTARSKIREVLRGLVATRQVHTLSMGHAPHFYVAGTLPEFSVTPQIYAGATLSGYSTRYGAGFAGDGYLGREEELIARYEERSAAEKHVGEKHEEKTHANGDRNGNGNGNGRPHFNRPAVHAHDRGHDRKPAAGNGARRVSEGRPAQPANGNGAKARPSGSGLLNARNGRSGPARPAASSRSASGRSAAAGTPASAVRKGGLSRSSSAPTRAGASTRTSAAGTRTGAPTRAGAPTRTGAGARNGHKPALAGSGSFRGKQGTKKRG